MQRRVRSKNRIRSAWRASRGQSWCWPCSWGVSGPTPHHGVCRDTGRALIVSATWADYGIPCRRSSDMIVSPAVRIGEGIRRVLAAIGRCVQSLKLRTCAAGFVWRDRLAGVALPMLESGLCAWRRLQRILDNGGRLLQRHRHELDGFIRTHPVTLNMREGYIAEQRTASFEAVEKTPFRFRKKTLGGHLVFRNHAARHVSRASRFAV